MNDQSESRRLFPDDWGIEAEKVVLYGGLCTACKCMSFPKPNRCHLCFSDVVERRALSGEGKLYSFSIIRVDSPTMQAPYAIGYVDLVDGPRLLAHLAGWEDQELKPDMAVQLAYGPLPLKDHSETVLTYKFEPSISAERQGSQA